MNAEESAVTKQQLCNDNESERQKRQLNLQQRPWWKSLIYCKTEQSKQND